MKAMLPEPCLRLTARRRTGLACRVASRRMVRSPGGHDRHGTPHRKAEPPVTTLLGELSDQAALAGVLNTLYELHLPVLTVERLSAG